MNVPRRPGVARVKQQAPYLLNEEGMLDSLDRRLQYGSGLRARRIAAVAAVARTPLMDRESDPAETRAPAVPAKLAPSGTGGDSQRLRRIKRFPKSRKDYHESCLLSAVVMKTTRTAVGKGFAVGESEP
jgi:hypothetical protein